MVVGLDSVTVVVREGDDGADSLDRSWLRNDTWRTIRWSLEAGNHGTAGAALHDVSGRPLTVDRCSATHARHSARLLSGEYEVPNVDVAKAEAAMR